MKDYLIHSLKYFLKLVGLLVVIYALLFVTGSARVSAHEFLHELFHERNGAMLLAALVALALVYPRFGFVKRRIDAGIDRDRDEILRVFGQAGYSMTLHSDGIMVFRASGSKRLINMYDDRIVLTYDDDSHITIEGIRKETVQIEFRIKSYVNNKTGRKGQEDKKTEEE